MGLDDWLVKISWLGKLASEFWCMELDFFSLEFDGVSSSVLRWVYVLGVALGSLYVDAQGYVPALLENLRGMSCPGTTGSSVVVGFSVGMESFGWSLIP